MRAVSGWSFLPRHGLFCGMLCLRRRLKVMHELQVQNGEDETLSAVQDALNQEELLNAAADFVDRYESVFENLSH